MEEHQSFRVPNLRAILDAFADEHGIEQEFRDASAHPYDCRCDKCLAWWCDMGPEDEDDPTFGPFSADEVESYCQKTGRSMWWRESR